MIPPRAVFTAMAIAMMAACARSDEGALRPIFAQGVSLGKRSVAGDTAVIERSGIRIRVWGDWGRDAGETVDIEYRNLGTAPVSIRVGRVNIAFGNERGVVEQISDVSRVNLDDTDYRNDTGRSLMSDAALPDRPGVVTIPARGIRHVSVSFLPFSANNRPRLGNMVNLSVPVPSGSVSVPLECAGP